MAKQNIIDKAFAAVAPVHAMRRMAARTALEIINTGYGNYGANVTKKTMRGWNYAGGSAKEDIEDNIDTLRQRSRDAYMGIPTASAALKTMRTNVVAGGLIPSPQIDGEYLGLSVEETERLQHQISREFSLWADTPLCDAEKVDNFYKLQQLAFLSYIMNGDAFALLPEKEEAGQPYSLRVRIIEADRICSPDQYDRLVPCDVQGFHVHQIVQGVETDAEGAVVAYWICNRHPLSDIATIQPGEMTWTRVEAFGRESGRRNVLHIMNRERAGQRRGVPILAPVLETIKQMGRYTDAEVTAAVLSSMLTIAVLKENPADGRPFGEMLPPDMQIDAQDYGTVELGSGAFVDMAPGEKIQVIDPKHPNTGYDAFTNALIRQIGAALEIPPEVLFKQFTTSYSAARGALNEFWRTCQMQRDWFKDDFCKPIYAEWFAEAVARGRINAPGFFRDPAIRKTYITCEWSGPARTNLNPVQEVTAAALRVENCFSTAADETAQMTGGDFNRVVRQRAIEAKQKKEVDEIIYQTKEPQPAATPGSEGGPAAQNAAGKTRRRGKNA